MLQTLAQILKGRIYSKAQYYLQINPSIILHTHCFNTNKFIYLLPNMFPICVYQKHKASMSAFLLISEIMKFYQLN